MRRRLSLPAAAALAALLACSAPAPAKDVSPLGRKVLDAVGLDRWRALKRIRFTWKHVPSGRVRGYDWNLADRTVAVTIDEKTVTIPAGGVEDEEEKPLHKAFVNDAYWFLFPLMATDDGSRWTALGEEVAVPGFDALGKTAALEVSYRKDEGYTGGDRYVLYVGEDGLPVAWAFHPGGAKEPRLVTTRGARVEVAGLSLPTRFATADGKTFIEIAGVAAE